MSLALVSSPRFADHVTPPGHPERLERAEVLEAIAARWHSRGGPLLEPRPATRDELARVHTARYIEAIAATEGRPVMLDADTFTSPATSEVARLAAGAALTGLQWVLAGDAAAGRGRRRAFALVRPPGHHAEAGRAMGFCIFNSIAVAAAAALREGLRRIAVVDFDVHHGNGTQHSFYDDPRVLFVSTHQYPFYPGTGAATEIGEGDGAGFTVNVPLEAGCTDGDYVLVFERVVAPLLDEFRPQLVLISAGFDAHGRDPLGHMRMTAAGFAALTHMIAVVADRHAEGRVLAVSEGGYDLPALQESIEATIGVLAAATQDAPAGVLDAPTGRGDAGARALRAAQGGRWHAL